MNDTDANWIDTLTDDMHKDAVGHVRTLIENEICYPVNVWAVLRSLPPHELRTVITVFERMRNERIALA